tara:strand:- start:188 stop:310 length:123 start_codon:yes stop_codon:yes gene_type:complete
MINLTLYIVSIGAAIGIGSVLQSWGFWNWLNRLTPWGKSH